jgi:predicted nucleic acid-binding Zn ribbon protein
MRKKNEVTIGEAMQEMLREFKLKSRLDETRVQRIWAELMGKTIATYTTQITVRKKVLYLTIISAPLKQELSYAKEKIVKLINEEMGEEYIREVVIN